MLFILLVIITTLSWAINLFLDTHDVFKNGGTVVGRSAPGYNLSMILLGSLTLKDNVMGDFSHIGMIVIMLLGISGWIVHTTAQVIAKTRIE